MESPRKICTPVQLKAAGFLAAGETIEVVAKKVKVARSTVYSWKRLPEFVAEIQKLQSGISDSLEEQVAEALGKAVKVVLAGLDDPRVATKVALEMLKKTPLLEIVALRLIGEQQSVGDEKPVEEMTEEEIDAEIDKLR